MNPTHPQLNLSAAREFFRHFKFVFPSEKRLLTAGKVSAIPGKRRAGSALQSCVALSLWASALFAADPASPPAPLLFYSFDRGGEASEVEDDSGGGRNATRDVPVGSTLPTVSEAGVFGRAFDNRNSTGMGSEGEGASVLYSGSQGMAFGELSSFSIVVWINAESMPGGSAQLFSFDGTRDPLILGMPSRNKVYLQVGENAAIFESPLFDSSGQWVFIAVTYNALAGDRQIRCYVGRQGADEVQMVGEKNFLHGPWNGMAKSPRWSLAVGNTPLPEKNRPFKGLMDQVRFYGSPDNETAALTQEELGKLFRADQK